MRHLIRFFNRLDPTEKAGWVGFTLGFISGLVVLTLVILATYPAPRQPRSLGNPADINCYEDEVVMWDGVVNRHTICVPLDLIAPSNTNTVVVDTNHCIKVDAGYLECEIDPFAHIPDNNTTTAPTP